MQWWCSRLEEFQATHHSGSTTEAEYVTALDAVKEGFWFKKFVAKLGVMSSDSIPLYYNKNGAITLAKEPRSHQKSKHIEQRYHIIHEYFEKQYIKVQTVDSTDNVVDRLTNH